MRVIGIVLVAVGVIAGVVARYAMMDDEIVGWILAIGGPVTIVLGAFLLYRGKQYAARGMAQAEFQREHPPVVYLRSFSKDESLSGQVFGALITPKMLAGLVTEEEQLAQAVAPIGPLVAIGRPGERLPKPGAIRAYATDAEWKDVVTHWLTTARLVILRPGITQGVWWEMEHAIATARPDRFILLLVRVKAVEYGALSVLLNHQLHMALPPMRDVQRWRRVSGFFEFGNDWTPRFLPLGAPYWRMSSYKGTERLFYYALRPVFERLGVPWRPLAVSRARIAAVGVLGIFGLLGLTVGAFFIVGTLTENPATNASDVSTEPAPGTASRSSSSASDWKSWSVAGLQIAVPNDVEPQASQAPIDRPAALQGAIEEFEGYKITSNSLTMTVVKLTYKPGIQFSIANAVQGEIRGMTAGVDGASVDSSTGHALVSGHAAMRLSALATVQGEHARLESVTFAVGQTLWQVQAVMPESPQAEATTRRIVESVALSAR